MIIADIQEHEDIILVTDSQDMLEILSDIGQSEDIRYYGCLFVKLDTLSADYQIVYGSPASVPRLTAPLDRLWPTDTLEEV